MKSLRQCAITHYLLIFGMVIGAITSARGAPIESVNVAVASNFVGTMKIIIDAFNKVHPYTVVLSSGSTGKHYAQIRNGAPYALFLAADVSRPEQLQGDGLVEPENRYTYAMGILALWSPDKNTIDVDGRVLVNLQYRRLAIANPKLAPYGRAAMEVLQRKRVWGEVQAKLVRGENIAQAFQYVHSGNAELGFVAYSQIVAMPISQRGSFWLPPTQLYSSIEQQIALLRETPGSRALFEFLRSEPGRQIISAQGYWVPER